jgi:hypothetical protein
MDSLLAGKIPPFQGRLACHCDVQRHCAVKNIPGIVNAIPGSGENRSPPESLFAFSPESCSSSPRNPFSRSLRNPFRLAPESAELAVAGAFSSPSVAMHNFDGVCIAVLPFKAEAPLIVDTDCGERGRNRTYNLVIKSHLLCQLSYAPGLVWRIIGAGPTAPQRDYIAMQPDF